MAITINLPDHLERALRSEYADLEQAAKEALVIEGYRTGHLGLVEVAQALGLPTTILALEWLNQRGVPLDYTLEDLEADRRALADLFRNAG